MFCTNVYHSNGDWLFIYWYTDQIICGPISKFSQFDPNDVIEILVFVSKIPRILRVYFPAVSDENWNIHYVHLDIIDFRFIKYPFQLCLKNVTLSRCIRRTESYRSDVFRMRMVHANVESNRWLIKICL